ncbi:hypothetical protein V9P86_32450, partial [Pseudomonas aeruginosa]
ANHQRGLVEQGKGHQPTLRLGNPKQPVHIRNQKTPVIGPDQSHRRNQVKGLLRAPRVRQAINEEFESERISQEKAQGL